MKMLNKQNSLKKVIRPNSNWFPHKSVLPMYYIIDMRTKQTRYLNLFCYQNKTALKLHDWFSYMEGGDLENLLLCHVKFCFQWPLKRPQFLGFAQLAKCWHHMFFGLVVMWPFHKVTFWFPSMHHYHNHNVNTCCYLISYIHDVSSFTKWILDPES